MYLLSTTLVIQKTKHVNIAHDLSWWWKWFSTAEFHGEKNNLHFLYFMIYILFPTCNSLIVFKFLVQIEPCLHFDCVCMCMCVFARARLIVLERTCFCSSALQWESAALITQDSQWMLRPVYTHHKKLHSPRSLLPHQVLLPVGLIVCSHSFLHHSLCL